LRQFFHIHKEVRRIKANLIYPNLHINYPLLFIYITFLMPLIPNDRPDRTKKQPRAIQIKDILEI
ncbi:MAG: hypothetical protein WA035_09785, partial [Trichococcus flocculiformis]